MCPQADILRFDSFSDEGPSATLLAASSRPVAGIESVLETGDDSISPLGQGKNLYGESSPGNGMAYPLFSSLSFFLSTYSPAASPSLLLRGELGGKKINFLDNRGRRSFYLNCAGRFLIVSTYVGVGSAGTERLLAIR